MVRAFDGVDRYTALLEGWLSHLKKRMATDEDASATPISKYWKKEIGDLSYVKGPLFLHVIERLCGTDAFDGFLRNYIRAYRKDRGATFENLQSELEAAWGTASRRCFSEWIHGAESSLHIDRAQSLMDLEREYA